MAELLAVEYLVFESAWKAAGNEEPPAFHGPPFYRMEDDPDTEIDEAHGFTPHRTGLGGASAPAGAVLPARSSPSCLAPPTPFQPSVSHGGLIQ